MQEIFDLFFTTKEKGIGSGLAIVYRIIESYRGIIDVVREDKKGSRFTIAFHQLFSIKYLSFTLEISDE